VFEYIAAARLDRSSRNGSLPSRRSHRARCGDSLVGCARFTDTVWRAAKNEQEYPPWQPS